MTITWPVVAAVLFGASTPLVQRFGAGIGSLLAAPFAPAPAPVLGATIAARALSRSAASSVVLKAAAAARSAPETVVDHACSLIGVLVSCVR